MALSFLLDEHLRGPLWRALLFYNLKGADVVDVVRVGEDPDLMLGTSDPEILLWAERQERILVTQDRRTMALHLAAHLNIGHHSPGVFMIREAGTIREVVEFIALAAFASEPEEWRDRIAFIP